MADDHTLYEAIQAGHVESLQVLITRHHRALFDFVFRLTDDRDLTDDLVQQTFIRLIQYRGAVPNQLRSWLFTIARNLAYDHFRSAQFRHESPSSFEEEEVWEADSKSEFPEQLYIVADERQTIIKLLQNLPLEQREVVILRFYHDLPLQSIAHVTNAPLGTVKSRLFHGLQKLKQQYLILRHADEHT